LLLVEPASNDAEPEQIDGQETEQHREIQFEVKHGGNYFFPARKPSMGNKDRDV
jgi:hypothetical protein